MINEYIKTSWVDHIVENPFTFLEDRNSDGTVILQPQQGEIIQQGTSVNAKNLNHLEEGIWNNWNYIKELYDEIINLKIDVLTLKGSTINDMKNNMFFISFATIDNIKLKSGIYDFINGRIYV